MGKSFLAKILGAVLIVQTGWALAAPAASPASTSNGGNLVEGRAVYEAQVNFGGARENDLGPGFDFGVPLDSKPRSTAANIF